MDAIVTRGHPTRSSEMRWACNVKNTHTRQTITTRIDIRLFSLQFASGRLAVDPVSQTK